MKLFSLIKEFVKFSVFILLGVKNPIRAFDIVFIKGEGWITLKNNLTFHINQRGAFGLLYAVFFQKIYGKVESPHTMIDIGANRGYFTVKFAYEHPNAEVHAFEPHPKTYQVLLETIKRNNLKNITVYPFAVTGVNYEEKLDFYINDNLEDHSLFLNEENGDEVIQVDGITLDQFCVDVLKNKYIDLLKLNCEGAEYDILENSRLLDCITHIRLEYHNLPQINRKYTVEHLKKTMMNKGFQLEGYFPFAKKHGIVWFKGKND